MLLNSRGSLCPSGDLCSAFIILIIILQLQYNAVGERKFWRKTQTKPVLHYPPDKALGNMTSLSANHWTHLPIVKIEKFMVCLSMEKESLEKHSFYKLCFPTGVRGSWAGFAAEGSSSGFLSQSLCCRDRAGLGTHEADVHRQGNPRKTQVTGGGFCDCSSDCNHLSITCNETAYLSRALGGTHWEQEPNIAPEYGCKDVSLDLRDTHPVTEKVISGYRIGCSGDVNLDKLQYGCVILDAEYLSKLVSLLVLHWGTRKQGRGRPSSPAGAEMELLQLKNDRMCKQILNSEQVVGSIAPHWMLLFEWGGTCTVCLCLGPRVKDHAVK